MKKPDSAYRHERARNELTDKYCRLPDRIWKQEVPRFGFVLGNDRVSTKKSGTQYGEDWNSYGSRNSAVRTPKPKHVQRKLRQVFGILRADRGGDDEKNCDARYGLDLLSLCGRICEEEGRDRITEDDVRQAQRLADMMRVYRA